MPLVIGFAGSSGSGKTTLIASLVPILRNRGRRVAIIKHDGHGHYKEAPGSDSAAFIEAGADYVTVAGKRLVARFEPAADEPELDRLVAELPAHTDIVLVEGYKRSAAPKIAVMLRMAHSEVLDRMEGPLLAVASGFGPVADDRRAGEVPLLDLHDPAAIAAFIERLMPDKEQFHPKLI